MTNAHRIAVFVTLTFVSTLAFAVGDIDTESTDSKVFERVFGVSRVLPKETVDAVLALPPGEKLARDTNGDGKTDELWYVDPAKRHTIQPMLVRVIDEDGDMHETGRGDRDSDCYFWDWEADGRVDTVTDYQDDDGDNDLDQMGIFYDKNWKDDVDDLTVWWSVDIGDDNLLWYDVNGTYIQSLCQWRTHFSGDELFYQFRLVDGEDVWNNVWEDPFAFYDPDGDTCSEVVVRISAVGEEVENLRYSIDADDDAFGRRTHNYDFSVTALPGEKGLSSAAWHDSPLTIRGIKTKPVLPWNKTMQFGQQADWSKAMLIWDEVNTNTDGDIDRDPMERWEGILNHKSPDGTFPQVGGPATSDKNKRFEITDSPASPLRLYFDPADRRLHLVGAAYGYMMVDYNFDGDIDAEYRYEDVNGDGILDHRTIDLDADGTVEYDWPLKGPEEEYALEFEAVSPFYTEQLKTEVNDNQYFIDMALAILEATPEPVQAIIDYFQNDLPEYHPETEAGKYVRESWCGKRYYGDLISDRLFFALEHHMTDSYAWPDVEAAYIKGNKALAAAHLQNLLAIKREEPTSLTINGHEYNFMIPVTVENTGGAQRDKWPITIDVADLEALTPKFNSKHCVVVADRHIAPLVVPHQVDTWDWDGGEEISFVADIPRDSVSTFRIFFNHWGTHEPEYPRLTGVVKDAPTYLAWESDTGAYRTYTGQFDYFGKEAHRLIPRPERLLYPLIDVNHHEQQEWGIDALHVNETSGLGGLTLYRGDRADLVQSPAGVGQVEFEYIPVGAGPVRAMAEFRAKNVDSDHPDATVVFRCFVYANRQESEIRVKLPHALKDGDLAPGLMKLTQEERFVDPANGCMGAWGFHGEDIGQIGIAVIVPNAYTPQPIDLEQETRLRCRTDNGMFTYWITGDWRRGMQYAVAPTIDNWQRTVTELAQDLHSPPTVTLGELKAE